MHFFQSAWNSGACRLWRSGQQASPVNENATLSIFPNVPGIGERLKCSVGAAGPCTFQCCGARSKKIPIRFVLLRGTPTTAWTGERVIFLPTSQCPVVGWLISCHCCSPHPFAQKGRQCSYVYRRGQWYCALKPGANAAGSRLCQRPCT